LIEYFNLHKIPYKERLRGFASDNASTMVGNEQGVATRLKKDIPDLVIIRWTCHSLARCALNACDAIPGEIEDLLHRLTTFFKNSGKRMQAF